jgi:hypothetical protein
MLDEKMAVAQGLAMTNIRFEQGSTLDKAEDSPEAETGKIKGNKDIIRVMHFR